MAQKMTLTAYLAQRGKKAKALTKVEAQVFGIPYPLQAGWPRQFGPMEITEEMLEQLEAAVARAKKSKDQKVRRSARRTAAALPASKRPVQHQAKVTSSAPPPRPRTVEAPLFPGFALRVPRRLRRSAPWT